MRSGPPRRSWACRPTRRSGCPTTVLDFYRQAIPRGQTARSAWEKRLAAWDGDRDEWDAMWSGRGRPGWQAKLPVWRTPGEQVATRHSTNAALNALHA